MSAEYDAINVSDQVAISANPTGIGPPIPIPITFNPLSGFLHVSGASLFGNPTVYPAPLGNVMIGRSSDLKLKALPMLYVRSTPDPPTPRDVILGDEIGPVGISVNSLIINVLNASTITVISPLSYWTGIKNLVGAETITGAKAQTGADHRLSHACLEGPEIGVYYRGKLINDNIIILPDYWKGLVDPESITVQLTPHGVYQELYVKEIQWGSRVIVTNNSGGPINCSYTIFGKRKDVPDLEVEYVGTEMKGGK